VLSSFGAVRSELRKLRRDLQAYRADSSRVSPSYEEQKIEQHIVELSFHEEVMWQLRTRVQWLKGGDKNTRFFHQKASNQKGKTASPDWLKMMVPSVITRLP
jgi:hypothetical protein